MYTTNATLGWINPTANLAVNKNRLKQYGEKIYLKNNTYFEIELFNPKKTKVLAKIYLDGVLISTSGIVIKPGQRVFLDRWIDEPKKFLFETYTVSNNESTMDAIMENGKIQVEFYDELNPNIPTQIQPGIFYYPYQQIVYGGTTQNDIYFTSNTTKDGVIGTACPSDLHIKYELDNSIKYYCSADDSTISQTSFETGRSEKGEDSNQRFSYDHSNYSQLTYNIVNMQILPESQKPVEINEIRNYCINCGSRHKKTSWKFCPTCGTKI